MIAVAIFQGLIAFVLGLFVVRSVARPLTRTHDDRLDERLLQASAAGQDGVIRAIARASRVTGRLAEAVSESKADGSDLGLALDGAVREIVFEWSQRRRFFRVFASFGSMSALVAVAVQFLWLSGGDYGLAGLVPGLPLRFATERAASGVAGGFSILAFAVYAARLCGEEGRAELTRVKRLAERLEQAAER
ncbi:MAG: hypothetical protein AAF411_30765 [Myxococcota bacterium]